METERLAAAATMLVLALGLVVVGLLGIRHRLTYALGDWTRETATEASWQQAHSTIGMGFVVAGSVSVATGLVALLVPSGAVGAVVVTGSILLLVPTAVGIARGLLQLEPR